MCRCNRKTNITRKPQNTIYKPNALPAMQPFAYSAPCPTCAHELTQHEAGAAMIGNFSSFNFSESLQQIMTQVRAVLLPELQKIQTIVQASMDKIDKVAERIDMIESRLHVIDSKVGVFALAKDLEQKIDGLGVDAKSTALPARKPSR